MLSVVGIHRGDEVRSRIARFWLLVALFTLIIITSAFTAVLTTFLLSKEIRLPVTEVHELLTERVGTTRSSNHLEYLRNVEGFRYVSELSLEEAASTVSSGRIKAFLGSRVSLEYIADHDCTVYVPNSNFDLRREQLAFPIQKGSPLLVPINRHIQEMWDSNDLAQLEYRHFVRSSQCKGFNTVEDVDTIELEEVAGVFCIVAGAALISIAAKLVANGQAAEWCPRAAEWCRRAADWCRQAGRRATGCTKGQQDGETTDRRPY